MSKVSGNIQAPAVVRTHSGLSDLTLQSPVASGSTTNLTVGSVQNTGNVAQSLDISASNAVGCVINGASVYKGSTQLTLPAALQPGDSVTVYVNVTFDTLVAGDADSPFSFDIEETWA